MRIEGHLYAQLEVNKPGGLLRTDTYNRLAAVIDSAVEERNWIAISGPIGSGKTELVDSTMEELANKYRNKVRIVNLYWPDRQGINIAEILNQIIYTLGDEFIGTSSPRRGKEIRMLQVLDILTSAKQRDQHIVLIIDEAQELHGNTLKALKRLWEYKYKGVRDLLSIVLIGQPGLANKIKADKEIRLRCHTHPLHYSLEERAMIAHHKSGNAMALEHCAALAERFDEIGDILASMRPAMERAIRLEEALDIKHFQLPKKREKKDEKGGPAKVDSSKLADLQSRLGRKADRVAS